MKKKTISLTLAMIICGCEAVHLPIIANATGSAVINNDIKMQHEQYKSIEEQYEIFINSDFATPEKIIKYEEMMEAHKAIANGTYTPPTRSADVKLGVPFRSQINSYYCGPATVQQVRGYYYGTYQLPSQDTIAAALGTTTNGTEVQAVVNYLNANFSQTYAAQWYFSSASNLYNFVAYDVACYKPSVAFITNTTYNNWLYSVAEHFLCFEGYVNDTTTNAYRIYVVDPFLNGHNIASGKYSVTWDDAYDVTYALIT